MRDVIYLVVTQRGVQRMTKTLPNVSRGETPVKITVVMPQEAFLPPTLSQEVIVNDWRQGIELGDVEFKQSVITGDEAELIRSNRLKKMEEILIEQGYEVRKPEGER